MSRRPTVAFVGPRLRAARAAAGMTQQELATGAGVSRPQVANIESGRGDPSLRAFVGLARFLKLDPGALLAEPECERCADTPPAGFACTTCGKTGAEA